MTLLQHIKNTIKALRETVPVFNIKSSTNCSSDFYLYVDICGQRVKINRFDLLPHKQYYQPEECAEYADLMVCYVAANRNVELQYKLYESTDILEVYKQYIIVLADDACRQ